MPRRLLLVVAATMGVFAIANGVHMTIAPESWYWLVPGVPDRGPFNQHFVRDIGICYSLIGLGFVAGSLFPAQRFVLWFMPTLWLSGHGLFHFWEVAVGLCGPEFLLIDFAGVTLPALVGTMLCWASYSEAACEQSNEN